jgi:hypothetical protein
MLFSLVKKHENVTGRSFAVGGRTDMCIEMKYK